MRVLHFYKSSLPDTVGGVEVFMDTLCKATSDLGVENTILTLADTPSTTPINMVQYKVEQAKQNLFIASTGFSIAAFAKFRRLARDADIIHYHFPNPFADILHFACNINKPTIITYHSDIVKQKYLMQLYRPLMHRFLDSIDKIITTSPNYFATSETLNNYKSKVEVIPIGLNKDNLPALNQARVNYWRRILPEKFFLFVGAMRYYKGLHFALKAIENTNYNLVLAGSGGNENELKAYVKDKKLNNVHFIGSISAEDKLALLHLCYAFIFPSHLRSEAFGISLLEAAAVGKPLISCEIGTGTSFVNIDQETGLVVQPSAPIALRNAMQYLIENNDKAIEFGKNAAKRFAHLFTADKQAAKYLSVYTELLNHHNMLFHS